MGRTKPQPPFKKAPTDFAEVKRRFIRQNRELAKNNSVQSLKIRSLENENSKLLAHNLELREINLDLERRLENAQNAAVGRVKRELKARLEELSGLVDGIDEEEYTREVVDRERVLSPSHQQYRERQPLAELMRDSQMPTIDEGEQFPRQSLATRISDGSAATGSPDLGPPPVARFECENSNAEGELLPSVNLETRRRRKEPSDREIRRSSILALSPVKLDVEPAATSMLRTGAKRKLADRDPERTNKKDDFSFTRRSIIEEERENEVDAGVTEKANHEPIKASSPPAKPTRRVLGDKSTNMSPRKAAPARTAKPAKEDPIKADPLRDDPIKAKSVKEEAIKSKLAPRSQTATRPPSRGRRISSAPQMVSQSEPVVASVELPPAPEPTSTDAHPPKTPAPPIDDLFSPEPSASQPAPSRDTPPPSDLSSLSNTTTDARPSRRARSSVNYAEPSLVAKMRRPGKGMVDAISGLQPSRRSISADGPVRPNTVEIKTEPTDEDHVWAARGSPLRERSTTTSSERMDDNGDKIVVSHPPRRESIIAESGKRREALGTSSSSAFPASKMSSAAEAQADKLAELDLYDFKDESSSPAGDVGPGLSKAKPASGRRHSSILKDLGSGQASTTAASKIGNAAKLDSGRAAGRRRSMML